ncbi:MAG: hypothetical protein OSW77_08655 [Proteobacteria bacterium]|nr:hypothetical protein [Pseudomonadota bacterium]
MSHDSSPTSPSASPDAPPATVTCDNCGGAVPNGAIYCPHCCGADGRDGAVLRGAFVGAVIGTMAGGLLAALWYSLVGPERGSWGMVLGVTVGCATTGLMLGMIRQRKG